MNDDKVYSLPTVDISPFPEGTEEYETNSVGVISAVGQAGDKRYSTPKVQDERQRKPRVARAIVGETLNSQSKQILATFTFGQLGAIAIGDIENGPGVGITPSGIIGKNSSGETTFAIDAATGSATFRGQILAGSLVAGEVIVGNNRVIIDVNDDGEPTIIVNDGTNDRVLIGFQENGF